MAVTVEGLRGAGLGARARFRTCPDTGLRVDLAAQALIKANAVAAVLFLAWGGLLGLLVALTRWIGRPDEARDAATGTDDPVSGADGAP